MHEPEPELSLSELLRFAMANWKILSILPLAAAIIAFLAASIPSSTYIASAQIDFPFNIADASPSYTAALPSAVQAGDGAVEVLKIPSGVVIKASAPSADEAVGLVKSTHAAVGSLLNPVAEEERANAGRTLEIVSNAIERLRESAARNPDAAITLLETETALKPVQNRFSRATAVMASLAHIPSVSVLRSGRSALLYAVISALATELVLFSALLVRRERSSRAITA